MRAVLKSLLKLFYAGLVLFVATSLTYVGHRVRVFRTQKLSTVKSMIGL